MLALPAVPQVAVFTNKSGIAGIGLTNAIIVFEDTGSVFAQPASETISHRTTSPFDGI